MGLLLGSFADKYLAEMSEEEMIIYDRLINLPSNDSTNPYQTQDHFDLIWAQDNSIERLGTPAPSFLRVRAFLS